MGDSWRWREKEGLPSVVVREAGPWNTKTALRLLRLGQNWSYVTDKTTCLVCAYVTYCAALAAGMTLFSRNHCAYIWSLWAIIRSNEINVGNAFPSSCYFGGLWGLLTDSASACRFGRLWGGVNALAGACHIGGLELLSFCCKETTLRHQTVAAIS